MWEASKLTVSCPEAYPDYPEEGQAPHVRSCWPNWNKETKEKKNVRQNKYSILIASLLMPWMVDLNQDPLENRSRHIQLNSAGPERTSSKWPLMSALYLMSSNKRRSLDAKIRKSAAVYILLNALSKVKELVYFVKVVKKKDGIGKKRISDSNQLTESRPTVF